jgi:hypothetical protein
VTTAHLECVGLMSQQGGWIYLQVGGTCVWAGRDIYEFKRSIYHSGCVSFDPTSVANCLVKCYGVSSNLICDCDVVLNYGSGVIFL